ncbi:MAG: tyrosine-protein phosphatase [Saprospiraceae bacterium]|nr:tyrosine-protein phosphatase [Pyrinomonadaceae bacterium]
MKKNFLRRYAAAWMALFSFAALGTAQITETSEFPDVKIVNFGKMDDRYYRGGQPLQSDYQSLKDLGVKTVIDLRNDPVEYEKPSVEALGMKYVNIPLNGWRFPNEAHVDQFLKLMNDPETGTVYVHCKAGRHRAGMMGGVYRVANYGWDYDEAYKEMKKFRYSSWVFHGPMKGYVKEFAKRTKAAKAETAAAGLQAAAANGN